MKMLIRLYSPAGLSRIRSIGSSFDFTRISRNSPITFPEYSRILNIAGRSRSFHQYFPRGCTTGFTTCNGLQLSNEEIRRLTFVQTYYKMAEARQDPTAKPLARKYDVFLVHSSTDNKSAHAITTALEARGLKTYAHYREGQEFDVGKFTYDCVVEAVEVSDRILILLTSDAIKSDWVTLEILLSLEKAQRLNKMGVRMVLDSSLDRREKEKIRNLDYIPFVTLDYNKENWEDSLVEKIKEEVSMADVLPAGNVAHGLVFNYFAGYLRHILPDLKDRIRSSPIHTDHGEHMAVLYYILLPESCQCRTLEGTFNDGEFVIQKDSCLTIESGHGDKKRSYNPVVYSITKRGGQTYYFLAECPTIMETIGKLASSPFVENFHRKSQLVRFRQTLSDLVNHKSNKEYNDSVQFIIYNDERSSHAEEIWNSVSVDVRISQEVDPRKQVTVKSQEGRRKGNKEIVASVTYSDRPEDRQTAQAVMDRLYKEEIVFTNGEGTEGVAERTPGFSYMEGARWNIIILSKDSLTDDVMLTALQTAINDSINKNKVKVIPVLSPGTSATDLPRKYRWVTVLESSKSNYLETLLKTVQGPEIKMHEKVPAGKVYEGLAWSYILNYLPVTLGKTTEGKDVVERFREARMKLCPGIKCVAKLFVIAPKTCSFPPPGTVCEGEVHLGALECVTVGFRKYFLQFYKLTLDGGEEVCYAREYATPTVAMYEMVNHFPSSGLYRDEMYVQSVRFANFVSRVINDDVFKQSVVDLSKTCTMVQFDDDKEPVVAVLKKELGECLKNGDFLPPETPP